MTEMQRILEAAEVVRNRLGTADICIVLGSGLGDYDEALTDIQSLSYSEISHFPASTVPGHAGKLLCGYLHGKRVMMMSGRFHVYEGYDLKDITRPTRVMAQLGVKVLLLTNAAGAVNTGFYPGDLMLISDHINLCGKNPLTGPNLDHFGTRFPDMSNVYDKDLRNLAQRAAAKENILLREGVYVMFSGPCYETPAEVRMARILGGDAVGMSTVPEAIVAVHSGMKVLGISCMTNMAAGILEQPLSHEEVMETGAKVRDKFRKMLDGIVTDLTL